MTNPISGSGKRTQYGRFMTDPQLLRTVAAPGDADVLPATIDALSAYIDVKQYIGYDADQLIDRGWAMDNLMHLQVVIPNTVTSYEVHVFGSLVGSVITQDADRWSYVFKQTGYTRSQIITLEQVPPGELKVLVTNVVGAGDVDVYFSITD
jgi:hypothetical protein